MDHANAASFRCHPFMKGMQRRRYSGISRRLHERSPNPSDHKTTAKTPMSRWSSIDTTAIELAHVLCLQSPAVSCYALTVETFKLRWMSGKRYCEPETLHTRIMPGCQIL